MTTPKIVVYQDTNFGGASREFTGDVNNLILVGFNDRISSIKVFGSVWVGYEDIDYQGRQYILEEGEYSHWDKWNGSNDQLSSLKMLNPDHFGLTPSIVVYQDINFGGRNIGVEYPIFDLGYFHFNDEISSLKVKTGAWILYEHTNFKGRQYIVTEGNYANWLTWSGSNDQISSMRPVKEPAFNTEVLSMTFDIASGLLNSSPHALVNLSQNNNTSSEQTASWSTTKTVTTKKTYEWHWDNSTAIKVETTFKTGVPVIADGKITASIENTFSIGEKRGSENTQQDAWSFKLPATVKPMTRLQVQVNIQEGKIDVPFKAVLKRGARVWEEQGTYYGTQSFNLHVDYNETPL